MPFKRLPERGDLVIFINGNIIEAAFCFAADQQKIFLVDPRYMANPTVGDTKEFAMASVMFWVKTEHMRTALDQVNAPLLNQMADDIAAFYAQTAADQHTDTGDVWDLLTRFYKDITGNDLDEVVKPEDSED